MFLNKRFAIVGLCITFLFASTIVQAQMDYPIFKPDTKIYADDSQKVTLSFYSMGYNNNTEYFGKIPYSGTLFGYQVIPEIMYQPTERFRIRAGVYAQQEFGRDGYTSLLPTFSVKYQATQAAFVLGTLEGNTAHGFIEPIYDYKWLINERLENGFQFFVNTKPYTHDFYINWRKAIHLGDPYKEEFDIGYSGNFHIINTEHFQLRTPMQMLYSHKGGQIDAQRDEPLTSIVNSALGISLNFDRGDKFFKGTTFDNYYVNYKDISGTKVQHFNEGNGFLSHLLLKFKYFDVDLRYWNGTNFINPRGNKLFSSVSEKDPTFFEKNRQLLMTSFIYNTEIFKGGEFNFRISPYHDFTENLTEYSYEMYFSYRLEVLLGKIKNSLRK